MRPVFDRGACFPVSVGRLQRISLAVNERNSIPAVLGNAAISVYDDGPTEITVGVPLSCPSCHGAYIAEYFGAQYTMMDEDDDSLEFVGTVPAAEPQVEVSDALTKISPRFAQVYDEAVTAANTGLEELSGAGYRRALEFLVKDYLISLHPEKRDEYVEMSLGACIRKHIDDPDIKGLAKEAAAIGNDYVHFEKYKKRDVQELRGLINLVRDWIELQEGIRDQRERMLFDEVYGPAEKDPGTS